jgi:SAM-dependent methyltransferase
MNLKSLNELSLRDKLSKWFKSPLGEVVFAMENDQLKDILPRLFGYHILQFGYCAELNYLTSSRISNKTILFLEDTEIQKSVKTAVRTTAEELPIALESVDVVLLPHILEYANDTHRLLREMERILISEGYAVIISINPFSLWGLYHLFFCWWNKMPWCGRLISVSRMKDWLSLLDFEIEKVKYFFFSPPVSNMKLLKKFLPLERLGQYCYPIFGGLYVVVAKKRATPLSPIKMKWQKKRSIIVTESIEPTSREAIKN